VRECSRRRHRGGAFYDAGIATTTITILSDLDGTLIDSKASVVRAFEWWAELRGLPRELAAQLPHGRPTAAAVAVLAPHLDAIADGALLDERQAQDTEGVIALPGARELLQRRDRLAIVTSCTVPLALARLTAAGLSVPATLVTPELTQRGKPDPAPYLLGAELMGADARECVVLEDAPAGVEAGRAAGMTVVAVLTTHDRDELPGADAYIADLTELPDALAGLGLE
jgi:mannitol-1-/sugar-/sorbitol-6-phosphatase